MLLNLTWNGNVIQINSFSVEKSFLKWNLLANESYRVCLKTFLIRFWVQLGFISYLFSNCRWRKWYRYSFSKKKISRHSLTGKNFWCLIQWSNFMFNRNDWIIWIAYICLRCWCSQQKTPCSLHINAYFQQV